MKPGAHVHADAAQTDGAAHGMPQPPQFAGSVVVSVQTSGSHALEPAPHGGSTTAKLQLHAPYDDDVTPCCADARYDERPARISIVIVPPAANVMWPEWTAAVQIDESLVYVPVPQSDPPLPPAGHV
jgi:hypothetical protein